MILKKSTIPNLLENAPLHQEALSNKEQHLTSWLYNVIDEFKHLSTEEIKTELRRTANPFAIAVENVIGDFNIATVLRNANAFNAKDFFYVGNKKFDRRGSCGSYHYKPANWFEKLDDFIALKSQYTFVGIDNVPGSFSLENYKLPNNPLFIFGSESVGLTPTMQNLCQDLVYIPQMGSVRSINVGCASAIVMFHAMTHFKNKIK